MVLALVINRYPVSASSSPQVPVVGHRTEHRLPMKKAGGQCFPPTIPCFPAPVADLQPRWNLALGKITQLILGAGLHLGSHQNGIWCAVAILQRVS